MSQTNLQVNLIVFSDNTASNNPLLRNIDVTYKLMGQPSSNPDSKTITLSPGEVRTIYDGTRSTSIDGTTAFTVTRPDPTKNVYRFTSVGGTPPAFRVDRVPGITTTTQFTVTVNGPIATMTASTLPFDTTNIQVGDLIKIDSGSGLSASNQGRFSIVAKTLTSVSFKNLSAVGETATVADASKILVYSNGGGVANQVQIGDKVVISAGFSSATFGQYEVLEVTPLYFDICAGTPNGLPLESSIIPTASGLLFYSQAKKFVMVAAEDKVAVRCNGDVTDNTLVEPIEPNNPEKVGLFLKNGQLYKLVLKSMTIDPVSVTYSTIE